MKPILLLIICLLLSSCKEQPIDSNSDKTAPFIKNQAEELLTGSQNPSLDAAILAIQALTLKAGREISSAYTLLKCADQATFEVNVQAACILGIGLISLKNANIGTLRDITARLLTFIKKDDERRQEASALVLARNPTLDFSLIAPAEKNTLSLKLPRDGRIALMKNLLQSGRSFDSSKEQSDAAEATEDPFATPFALASAFYVLYRTNAPLFQRKFTRYCSVEGYDFLASRCWRLLAILLENGFRKTDLLSFTNRGGGNWLVSLSGEAWNYFAVTEPVYAKTLTEARE